MLNEYIITYKSIEHYEVLGWIQAESLDDAKQKVSEKFSDEIKKYGIIDATIAEWKNGDNIHLKHGL